MAYYELGGKVINVTIPATIPNNTAVVITLYVAYNSTFGQQYDADINIVGFGRRNIKTIIWSIKENTLHFSSDFENKRLYYSGYNKSHLNKLVQNEFSKDADVIYSSYRSPVNINVFYDGKY